MHPFAIQPIQQFSYTKGKNALDMCMAIDAMDLLYTEKIDCFALVTSDSDFVDGADWAVHFESLIPWLEELWLRQMVGPDSRH